MILFKPLVLPLFIFIAVWVLPFEHTGWWFTYRCKMTLWSLLRYWEDVITWPLGCQLRSDMYLKHGNQDDYLYFKRNSIGGFGSCPGKILLEATDTPTRCYWERNFDTAFGITMDAIDTPTEWEESHLGECIYFFQFKWSMVDLFIFTQYTLLRNVNTCVTLFSL